MGGRGRRHGERAGDRLDGRADGAIRGDAGVHASAPGTPPPVTEPGFALWDLPSGDLIELFEEGRKPTFGTAPVVGFLVDDLEASRRDLEAAGGEVVSSYGPNEDGYATYHFRAPDGNLYEIVRDPMHEARAARSERG